MGLIHRHAATILLAGVAATSSSPWWRRRRRVPRNVDAVAQAVAPWAALGALPLVLALRVRRPLAVGAVLVGATGLWQLAWINGRARTVVRPAGRATVRIAHFNLWYDNRCPASSAATIATVDADIVTFSEFTPAHRRRLQQARADASFPHRLERPRTGAAGAAIWSRHPLTELARRPLHHERLAAAVTVGAATIHVDTMHTRSPMLHARDWASDLDQLAAEAPLADGPAIMIGDFNAAWTHPGFRAIVAQGWRDAHRDRGVGRRNSWRADRHWLPLFVRLDHALVNRHLDVANVEDVTLPGSDHRGLIVTLVAAIVAVKATAPH